jgi:hypothetical protein
MSGWTAADVVAAERRAWLERDAREPVRVGGVPLPIMNGFCPTQFPGPDCMSCSPLVAGSARKNKYGARKKEIDGHVFDSTKEAEAYRWLKALESAREISALHLQPRFCLQEGFLSVATGHRVRAIYYVADFSFDDSGRTCVVDVKSKATRTAAYRIKAKMFRAKFPKIDFQEWM